MYDINKEINFGEDGMIRSIIALTCFVTKQITPPNFEKKMKIKGGVFFLFLASAGSKYNLQFT